MKRFQESGLDKDAEGVICGEHLTMGNIKREISGRSNLRMFMKLRPRDNNWERAQFGRTISYYDFAPTIMDLLEIDYEPGFHSGGTFGDTKQGKLRQLATCSSFMR
jgi:hypothetical protein